MTQDAVAGGLNLVTSYGYDEVGNRISQTDANQHTTTYGYDNLGRRTSRKLPAGQSESYTYDAAGNLKTKVDFNGKTTTYGLRHQQSIAVEDAGPVVQRAAGFVHLLQQRAAEDDGRSLRDNGAKPRNYGPIMVQQFFLRVLKRPLGATRVA